VSAVCVRCAESLVDPERGCGFCRDERIREAVEVLRAAAKSTSNASLLARLDAIETLRSFGFSDKQVIQARAHALDGHSTEQILGVLQTTSVSDASSPSNRKEALSV
jgi:hypothetical protein